MKVLSLALTVLSILSTPVNVGVGQAAADYLRPVLTSIGGGARINYAGICPGEGKLHLPRVDAQPAPEGITGITAVRQIFRSDPRVTVTQDQSGMLRITIGSVSTSILQTRIPTLTLDSAAQYTPASAIDTIGFALHTYAVEHGLDFDIAKYVIDHLVSGPAEGEPHLPPLMQNVTADDALNSVARTFKGIVLYGTCSQPDGKELFKIDYIYGS
jgi:hypothetical protein